MTVKHSVLFLPQLKPYIRSSLHPVTSDNHTSPSRTWQNMHNICPIMLCCNPPLGFARASKNCCLIRRCCYATSLYELILIRWYLKCACARNMCTRTLDGRTTERWRYGSWQSSRLFRSSCAQEEVSY